MAKFYNLTSFLLLMNFLAPNMAKSEPSFPHLSSSPEELEFNLVTIGPGDEVYSRGGHLVLRIRDRSNGADYAYNWGMFDFGEPGFGLKFFRGVLNYSVDLVPFSNTVDWYRNVENRSVMQNDLHLTSEQKRIVVNRIKWWLMPEHLNYRYNMRFQSCATIIRDILNEATANGLRSIYEQRATNEPFRAYMLRWNIPWPFFYMALDILLNSTIDQSENAWIRMYRPSETHQLLADAPQFDANGKSESARNLLGSVQVIYQGQDFGTKGFNGYWLLLPILAVLAGALTLLAFRQKGMPFSVAAGGFGCVNLLFGVFAGLLGLVMLSAWIFSEHQELAHNANLLLFWPTDFAFCVVGWKVMRGRIEPGQARLWRRYLTLHGISAIILLATWSFGLVTQDVSSVLLTFVPLLFGLILGSVLIARVSHEHSQVDTKSIPTISPRNIKSRSRSSSTESKKAA